MMVEAPRFQKHVPLLNKKKDLRLSPEAQSHKGTEAPLAGRRLAKLPNRCNR